MHEPTPPSWRTRPIVLRLLLVGAVGGLLSGMFGVGGGILMVPLLVTLVGMDHRRAAATSLVAIIPTAAAGMITYAVRGEVDVPAGLVVAAGAIAGSIVGTTLLRRISLPLLRWLFLALLLGVAARMLLVVPVRGADVELSAGVVVGLLVLGVVMGVASGLFGIGGGVIAVPVLVALFGAGDLVAKGTSLLIMLPTAITGSLRNARAGLVEVGSGLVVGAAATVASIGGAALAFLLSPRLSSLLFVGLVLLSAGQIVAREIKERRAARGRDAEG